MEAAAAQLDVRRTGTSYVTSPPFHYRLSSASTATLRLIRVAGLLGFIALFASGMLREQNGSRLTPLTVIAAMAVTGLVIALVLAMQQRDVWLENDTLRVRGWWREWRVPASHVVQIFERSGFVRLTLRARVPGLGRHIRFYAPLMSSYSIPELLQVVSGAPRAGA